MGPALHLPSAMISETESSKTGLHSLNLYLTKGKVHVWPKMRLGRAVRRNVKNSFMVGKSLSITRNYPTNNALQSLLIRS
jgi:hypothetical protein